jgi:hypothetical protein
MVDDVAVSDAIRRMQEAAELLPGTFRAEFALVVYGGVAAGAGNWAFEVEGDIAEGNFAVWGHSPQEAVIKAVREAWRRVPPR